MKSILVVLAALVLTSACSSLKPGCLIEPKLAALASDVVASKLQCENKFAVQMDVTDLVKGIGLCKLVKDAPKPTGPIADAVCPLAVNEVVEKLASVAVPAEWKCSLTDVKGVVKPALTELCKKLPVSHHQGE
jgi:hypothetical protein